MQLAAARLFTDTRDLAHDAVPTVWFTTPKNVS